MAFSRSQDFYVWQSGHNFAHHVIDFLAIGTLEAVTVVVILVDTSIAPTILFVGMGIIDV